MIQIPIHFRFKNKKDAKHWDSTTKDWNRIKEIRVNNGTFEFSTPDFAWVYFDPKDGGLELKVEKIVTDTPKTTNLKEINKLFKANTVGYYLSKGNKFTMFSTSEDDLHSYVEDKIGKWSMKNADEWREYVVEAYDEDGNEESYSW